MINILELLQNTDGLIRIICTDGTCFDGYVNYIDDPDESGVNEWGVSFTTVDGGFIEIGESEIRTFETL